jgi:hypothetical protein
MIKHEHSKLWYLLAGVAVVLLIIFALLQNSASMAIVILIGAGVYLLFQSQPSRDVKIIVSEIGIKIGEIFYPYSDLKSFYLEYRPPVRRIYFSKKGNLNLRFTFDLPADLDPAKLREYLLTQLQEEEESEQSFLENFLNFIKF